MNSVAGLPLAVLASILAALVATFGLVLVRLNDNWTMNNRVYFAAFASGVLVTTALVLMTEAMSVTANAAYLVLGGYLLLYAINLLFQQSQGAILAPLLAVGIHSFLDGVEYGILFDHDTYVGWLASIGLISHEFAEAVILYAVLRAAKLSTFVAWLLAFLGAALTTPLGALASQPLLAAADPKTFAMLLAAASGALLYVGATHLPTHTEGGVKSRTFATYLLGILVATGLSLGHAHGGDDDHHDDHEHADSPSESEHGH